MTFEQGLKQAATEVERRLSSILTDDIGSNVPDRLKAAMRHAVLGGGKRFRPFLVLESAALFGVPADQAIETAAALELVHCYSLVHDDLPAMDNDTLRRGEPTVWKAYDDWTAILAGDALLTLAFEVQSHQRAHPNPTIRGQLIAALARAGGAAGMVGGQCLDLESEKLVHPPRPDADHILRLQAMKTGALIRFACEAGALLGGAEPAERQALASYGDALGLAFQIADDLLDVEGSVATVGKAVGKDAEAGKATLVSLIGIPAARQRLAEAVRTAASALDPFGPRADGLREAALFVSRRQH